MALNREWIYPSRSKFLFDEMLSFQESGGKFLHYGNYEPNSGVYLDGNTVKIIDKLEDKIIHISHAMLGGDININNNCGIKEFIEIYINKKFISPNLPMLITCNFAINSNHSVCVIIDPKNKKVQYFDPYGNPASNLIAKDFKDAGYTLNSNTVKVQSDGYNCFFYAVSFIAMESRKSLAMPAINGINDIDSLKNQGDKLRAKYYDKTLKEPGQAFLLSHENCKNFKNGDVVEFQESDEGIIPITKLSKPNLENIIPAESTPNNKFIEEQQTQTILNNDPSIPVAASKLTLKPDLSGNYDTDKQPVENAASNKSKKSVDLKIIKNPKEQNSNKKSKFNLKLCFAFISLCITIYFIYKYKSSITKRPLNISKNASGMFKLFNNGK